MAGAVDQNQAVDADDSSGGDSLRAPAPAARPARGGSASSRREVDRRLWRSRLPYCQRGPISGNHLSRSLQPALSSEGLPPIRFQDLRHAMATFLALQQVAMTIAMAVLGHSSASSTLEVYMRVAVDLAREAADAMDSVLRRNGGRLPGSSSQGNRALRQHDLTSEPFGDSDQPTPRGRRRIRLPDQGELRADTL
jgi:Phage integrase family